jgi:hypothetical protein
MIVKMIMKDDDYYMGVINEGGVLWKCILGAEGVIEEYL